MNNKKLLYCNRILSFIAFLFAFGRLCYELGYNKDREGFAMLIIFPMFYFVLLIISHWLVNATVYTKRPYVFTATITVGFISLMWIAFMISLLGKNVSITAMITPLDVIYNCIITLISLAIGVGYFLLAFNFKDK